MKNMIVYVKTGCPWCKEVLDFLNEKKIVFEERNVTQSKAYFDEMLAKSGQTKAPTLDIDGHILSDSDKDQVEAYLREKGILK
jgi:glutaredoxin